MYTHTVFPFNISISSHYSFLFATFCWMKILQNTRFHLLHSSSCLHALFVWFLSPQFLIQVDHHFHGCVSQILKWWWCCRRNRSLDIMCQIITGAQKLPSIHQTPWIDIFSHHSLIESHTLCFHVFLVNKSQFLLINIFSPLFSLLPCLLHYLLSLWLQPMESIAQRIHKLHEYKTSKFFVQKKTKLILLAKYWQRILGRKVIFPSLWTEQKVSNLNIALIVNKNFLRFQRRGEE